MIFKILRNNSSIKTKLKQAAAYYLARRGAEKAWKQRHNTVFIKHPTYKVNAGTGSEKSHVQKWSVFNPNISTDTFNICCNISGKDDESIVPEEIYQVDIEPTLNNSQYAGFQCHKSFYQKWYGEGLFPEGYIHVINGEYFNSDLEPISFGQVADICESITYPVILKPNCDTRGGRGIIEAESPEKCVDIIAVHNNLLVQQKIRQHEQLGKFHHKSLNTVRVDIYKSVNTNQVHFLHASLRMGKDGSLDNLSSGGVVSYINEDGVLHGYALDKYGKRFTKHPNSGFSFSIPIPNYGELKNISLDVARKVFYLRTFALDLSLDHNKKWKVIEINPASSIRFAQYAGKPFFREFTEEVIEYCKNNHWAFNSFVRML